MSSSRFTPLTPRIGAKAAVRREDVLAPAFADECLDALERHGVLLFPRIGLSDEEQVAFSNSLGEVIPMGARRPDGTQEAVYKITLDPRENPMGAEYLKATIEWHIDGLFEEQATMPDRKRREATLQKIQQLMHEKVMHLPLFESAFLNGVGPKVAESGLGLVTNHLYSAPFEDLRLKK